MNLNKMYGLFLRHFYLIKSSLPRILDLIYWPTIQIILWGFISKFFSIYSDYYNNTLGIILTCAILYDILFRSSISFNMLFLEEIWSRNFTNLFIAPLGCIYYPIEILPEFFQVIAKGLPLVYIFDETRNILINDLVDYENIKQAYLLNLVYLIFGIGLFYLSFLRARVKGTLINMGE